MIHYIGDIVGHLGIACFLTAYFQLQRQRWQAQSYRYFGTNLAGSILLLISLMIDWNLSAFVLEALWGLISMWGLITLYRART